MNKYLDKEKANQSVGALIDLFEIASVNRVVIENALESDFSDFEDAVLHESARLSGTDYIITRDSRDFKRSKIPAYTPTEFLGMLESL